MEINFDKEDDDIILLLVASGVTNLFYSTKIETAVSVGQTLFTTQINRKCLEQY